MPTPTFSTAATILTQVRAECGVGATPKSVALQDPAMLGQLDDVNSEFVNYPYTVGMLGWTFLGREQIIETIANTTLNGAVAIGATTLTLDSPTGWDDPADLDVAAGYVRTGNRIYDYFTYEDLAVNDLEVVDGIQFAHTDESQVSKIYKLNSDFGKPRNLFRESNSFEYFYEDDDFRQVPRTNTYFIKTLTSTNNFSASFIVFRDRIGVMEFKFNYMKDATTIDDTTDRIDAPDGDSRRFIIERMKEYVWNHLGEENDAIVASQRAERAIIKASSQWSTQHIQPNQNISLFF